MEKIRLKFAFALVFCVLSCFFVFAQDEGGSKEKDSSNQATGADETAPTGGTPSAQTPSTGSGGSSTAKGVDDFKQLKQTTVSTQPAKYTVTFDAGNGDIISPEEVEKGQTVTNWPDDPKKKGYQFGGWFTKKDGGGKEFRANSLFPNTMTLYAKWIPVYAIMFDADNGDVNIIPPKDVEKDQTVTNWPDDPVKKGYLFKGWFTEEDGGGEEFTETSKVVENKRVYANWTFDTEKILDDVNRLETTINDLKYTASPYRFVSLVVTGIFALLLTALSVILLLSVKSAKKEIHRLDAKAKDEYDQIYRDFTQKFADITENPPHWPSNSGSSSFDSSAKDVSDIKNGLDDVQNRIQKIEENIRNLEENIRNLNEQKKITQSITSGSLSVPDAFNLWAGNPSIPLPRDAFYYIEGEVNIRVKHEIKESAMETKWITNRKGSQKYLFPNPNLFNQMTDILKLYKMDQTKLKGRGQNRIKIVNPCEMTKDGFVEFPGELELL